MISADLSILVTHLPTHAEADEIRDIVDSYLESLGYVAMVDVDGTRGPAE